MNKCQWWGEAWGCLQHTASGSGCGCRKQFSTSLPCILKALVLNQSKEQFQHFFRLFLSPLHFCFSWSKLLDSAKCINRLNCPFLFTERHRWRHMLLTRKRDSREGLLKWNSNSVTTLHCCEKNLGDSRHQVLILHPVQCLFPEQCYSYSDGELTTQGLADNHSPSLY